jgi:hypothetical protein
MVAIDAYEERVLQLISGKQNLFDNVIDPEATEDVVGISTHCYTCMSEIKASIYIYQWYIGYSHFYRYFYKSSVK